MSSRYEFDELGSFSDSNQINQTSALDELLRRGRRQPILHRQGLTMPNIFGDSTPQTWTDPATGVVYNAATMEPLHTVGDDLGELPGRSTELTDLDGDTAADDFAALLGIDSEKD